MALLRELVVSPESIVFLTSPSVVNEGIQELAEPIGSFDHFPISVKIKLKIRYKPVIPRSAKWQSNGVAWSYFIKGVELLGEPNISHHISCFNGTLTSAANLHVGKSKPSKTSKPWVTPIMLKSAFAVIFNEQYTTTCKNGLTLVRKSPRQFTRLRQRVGKIFSKMRCPTPMNQTCEKSFRV